MKHKVSTKGVRDFIGDSTVLIVEPSINYKNSLRGFFSNFKISNLKFVNSVREAKRAMLGAKVGLIIAEWDLPDENGIQFCRAIRESEKHKPEHVPFLLISVENMKRDVILASEVGIDGYLLKPFSYEDFSESLNNLALLKANPNQLVQLLDRAEALVQKGDLHEAMDEFQNAEQIKPGSARALSGMARIFARQGEISRSIDFFRRAIEYNPDYLSAYRELLDVLEQHGSTDEVRDLAEKINALSPGNPKYTMILAKAELELGRIEKSESYFRMTIRLSPRLADAYKGLGKVNIIKEDYESAMKNFNKALDLDVNDISCLNSLGLAYVKMEKFSQGVEKYRAALKIRPDDSRILFNLGFAKEKLGEYDQAAFFYRQALSHNPAFTKAQRRLDRIESKKR